MIWHKISAGKGVLGSGGEALVTLQLADTKVPWHSELSLMPLPPRPNSTWDVFEIQFRGGKLDPISSYNYKTKWGITGQSSGYQVIETPAGVFENCLQIQYNTKMYDIKIANFWHIDQELAGNNVFFDALDQWLHDEMNELHRRIKRPLHLEDVWLAPGVGAVKIETPNGIAELIDYDIKPAQ